MDLNHNSCSSVLILSDMYPSAMIGADEVINTVLILYLCTFKISGVRRKTTVFRMALQLCV